MNQSSASGAAAWVGFPVGRERGCISSCSKTVEIRHNTDLTSGARL